MAYILLVNFAKFTSIGKALRSKFGSAGPTYLLPRLSPVISQVPCDQGSFTTSTSDSSIFVCSDAFSMLVFDSISIKPLFISAYTLTLHNKLIYLEYILLNSLSYITIYQQYSQIKYKLENPLTEILEYNQWTKSLMET